jgi:hypothetical protein
VLLLHAALLPCEQQLHDVLLLHGASGDNRRHSSLTLFASMMRLLLQLLLPLRKVSLDAEMAAGMLQSAAVK